MAYSDAERVALAAVVVVALLALLWTWRARRGCGCAAPAKATFVPASPPDHDDVASVAAAAAHAARAVAQHFGGPNAAQHAEGASDSVPPFDASVALDDPSQVALFMGASHASTHERLGSPSGLPRPTTNPALAQMLGV